MYVAGKRLLNPCQLLFIHISCGFILKGRFIHSFFSSLTLLSCYFLVIEEKGVKMKLTVIDTPGFGDQINNENWWEQHLKRIIYNSYTNTVESKSLRPQLKMWYSKSNLNKVLEINKVLELYIILNVNILDTKTSIADSILFLGH